MNSDNLLLREATYSGLTTVGTPLTKAQFDSNVIETKKDFDALSVTLGVDAYSPATTYDDTENSYATYNGRFWRWVNASSGSGVTPVNGSDWQEAFPTLLAHEKNKDEKLQTLNGFTVRVDDTTYPKAICEFDDPATDWVYLSGTLDASGVGGEKQVVIAANNTSTNESLNVTCTTTQAKMVNSISGITTAAVIVENAKIRLKTTAQIAATIAVGDKVTAVNINGDIEFEKGSWTTAARPSTPYAGRDGFNTDLAQREYWDGSTWIQY